jgi:hypothetical protein
MSTVSGTGSNTTTNAMLVAIMKLLYTMDDKLKGLDPLCEKGFLVGGCH